MVGAGTKVSDMKEPESAECGTQKYARQAEEEEEPRGLYYTSGKEDIVEIMIQMIRVTRERDRMRCLAKGRETQQEGGIKEINRF